MMFSIKKIFVRGIKAFVPVAVTFAVIYWVFNSIETFFGHTLQLIMPGSYYFLGLGTLVGILFVCLVGILVNAWVIKQLYQLLVWMLHKIPFVNTIYSAMLDLVGFFDARDKESQVAVVVETPLGKMIGFVTRQNLKGLPAALGDGQNVLVFIPFSYQLGGFTLSMPKTQIQELGMPANEAMSLVLTAGLTGSRKNKDNTNGF